MWRNLNPKLVLNVFEGPNCWNLQLSPAFTKCAINLLFVKTRCSLDSTQKHQMSCSSLVLLLLVWSRASLFCEERRLLRFKYNISLLEHFIFNVQSAPLNSPTGRLEEVNRLSLHICLMVYAHLISSTPPDIPVNWQLSMTPQSYSGLQFRVS